MGYDSMANVGAVPSMVSGKKRRVRERSSFDANRMTGIN